METTAFLTDQYELTMLQSALEDGLAHKKATFELFARKLPQGRKYGVVAGIGRAIEAVENFHFTDKQISFLRERKVVTEATLEYLANFHFSGRITAYHEGELYFPYSPILTVEATFGEAVLLETVLLSIMNFDSAVASAAARMVQAGKGLPIIEMGSRRAHEQAAVSAARAAYIAGFTATSNLEAGMEYGIPTTGTSAHAFSLAHHDEKNAFRQQIKALGVKTTLLVDTYDIEQGIRNAVEVAGPELGGIRIDSGDLYEETTKARILLDELGAVNTKIILSSDIDEYVIDELMDRNIPVDGIGAGTKVVTGSGHPTAGMVYKLVAIEENDGTLRSVAKKASGKISVGGRKWAWRQTDSNGHASRERVWVRNNRKFAEQYVSTPETRTLQKVYIEDGKVVFNPTLEEIKAHHEFAMSELRPADKNISSGFPAVEVSV
jgi:nicotinate phosphoribosyltransferase